MSSCFIWGIIMHLVIYFAGTGDTANVFRPALDYLEEACDDVRVIIVEGCQHPEVCNDGTNPNLAGFATRFVDTLLTHDADKHLILNDKVDLNSPLKIGIQDPLRLFKNKYSQLDNERFDDAIQRLLANPVEEELENLIKILEQEGSFQHELSINRNAYLKTAKLLSLPSARNIPIETLSLSGYSRGAVTTFEVAKSLQTKQFREQAPLTPVNVIAHEPVPGNLTQLPGTNAYSVSDCSKLHNIVRADLTIAAYTASSIDKVGLSTFHRLAFNQVIPEFSPHTHTQLTAIPRPNHWSASFAHQKNLFVGLLRHLNNDLKTRGNHSLQPAYERAVQFKNDEYNSLYFESNRQKALPSPTEIQKFYGRDLRKTLFRYLDQANPYYYLRSRFNWRLSLGDSLATVWKKIDGSFWDFGVSPPEETMVLTTKINETSRLIDTFQESLTLVMANNHIPEPPDIIAAKAFCQPALARMTDLYEFTANWLEMRGPNDKRYEVVESLRTLLYFYLDKAHIPNLKFPIAKREEEPNPLSHAPEPYLIEEANTAQSSQSLWRFFPSSSIESSVAAFYDFEHHNEAFKRAIARTCPNYSEDKKAWTELSSGFSPTAHALREALLKPEDSAFGKTFSLSNLNGMIYTYLNSPLPPVLLPQRSIEVVMLEEQFRNHLRDSLQAYHLHNCIPKTKTESKPMPSSSVMIEMDDSNEDEDSPRFN